MRKLFGATLATFAIATIAAAPAGAADMAAPPYQPPPVPVAWSWTGATIGIHGGGAWGTKSWDLTSFQFNSPLPVALDSTATHTVNGFFGGGQLGANYQIGNAVIGVEARSATEIFGSPDDLKLRSCATLFASVSPPGSVFDRLLEKYYRGERDEKTLRLLDVDSGESSSTAW